MIHVRISGIKASSPLASVVLFACLFSSCNRIPKEYREFLDLSPAQQREAMKKLPPNRRIDFYLAGMRYVEPPQIELADDIAREGKPVLPILVQRLREEKDETNQLDIMFVFEAMHQRFYRLNQEPDIVNLLRKTTDGMKDSWHKQRGEEILKYIETDQLPDLEKTLGNINN